MSFVSEALTLIGSGALGGITGLVGTFLHNKGEKTRLKISHAHVEKMAELDQNAMKIEAELGLKQTLTEGEITRDVADAQLIRDSYQHDKATYLTDLSALPSWARGIAGFLFGFVDFVRGLIRPSVTLYMLVVTHMMYLHSLAVLNKVDVDLLTTQQALDLVTQIVAVVLYLVTTCVTWWFGSRQRGPATEVMSKP